MTRRRREAIAAKRVGCFGASITDAVEALNRLEDAMIEDIMSMTDEEILAEAAEDGINVEERAAEMREMIRKAIADWDDERTGT